MRLLDQRAGWPPTAAASLTAQALRCISSDAACRPSFLELASLLQDLAKTTREAVTSEISKAGGASVASLAGGASVEVASVASPRVESSRQLDDGGAHCNAIRPQNGREGMGAKAQTARFAHEAAPGGGSSVRARVAHDAAAGGGCSGSWRGMPIQFQQQQPAASPENHQDFQSVAAPPPPPAGRLRPPQAVCLAAQSGTGRPPLQQHTVRYPTPPRASFVPPQPANASGILPAAAVAAAAAARGAAVRAACIEPQKPLGASGSAPPGAGLQQWQQPVAPQRRVAAFPVAGAQLAPRAALPQRVAAGCPGLQLSAGIGGPALARGVACGQLTPIANAPVMPAVRVVPRAVYGR